MFTYIYLAPPVRSYCLFITDVTERINQRLKVQLQPVMSINPTSDPPR